MSSRTLIDALLLSGTEPISHSHVHVPIFVFLPHSSSNNVARRRVLNAVCLISIPDDEQSSFEILVPLKRFRDGGYDHSEKVLIGVQKYGLT